MQGGDVSANDHRVIVQGARHLRVACSCGFEAWYPPQLQVELWRIEHIARAHYILTDPDVEMFPLDPA
jgi:hypothetical protein